MKTTTDALEIMRRIAGDAPEVNQLLLEERANLDVAEKLIELRTKAHLSQAELARKVGTTQSVISRLEDADYDGHSLTMLKRIATALDKRVEIRFVPEKKTKTRRQLQHA